MTPELVKRGSLAIVAFGFGLAALTSGAVADRTGSRTPVADRWAVVNSDGTLSRSMGAVSSALISRGTYRVTFAASVAQCVFQATLGNARAGTPPIGKISVATAAGFGASKAVLVVARTSAGTPTSAGFHLFVSCPDSRDPRVARTVESSATTAATESRLAKNDRWAKVNSLGNLVRGRGVVETRLVGDGAFEVIFNRNVTQCAYIASRGPGVYHESAQIGVAARSRKPNGVYVLTTTYAGDPLQDLFYLALKCPPPAAPAEAVARRTDSADLWAVVRADGSLVRSFGVLSSVRVSVGDYKLLVDKDGLLYKCMFLVTLGTATAGEGAPSGHGWASDVPQNGNEYVRVRTYSVQGPPPSSHADRPFHLYVVCR